MTAIEIREDGGDFMEILVDNVLVLELCTDEDDFTTVDKVVDALAKATDASVTRSNDKYVWNSDFHRLVPR
jgi:hypothetical protein